MFVFFGVGRMFEKLSIFEVRPQLLNNTQKNMEKLNILENQFGVGKSEFSTGILLKNDESYYLSDVEIDEVYEVFDTYQSAKEFAISKVQNNPKIECWIINFKNETVFYYNKNGERKLL